MARAGAYAACVPVVAAVVWIVSSPHITPRSEPVARVDLPPTEIKAGTESHTAVARLEVVSSRPPQGAWLVSSQPLQAKQIVVTSPLRPDQLAGDEELSGVLAASGKPGLVRTRGKAFAAFELGAQPPAPAPAHPPGSGIAPPRTDV